MQQRVVVALNPELVDGVGNTKGQLLFVNADGTDVLKPAAKRVDTYFCLEGGGDLVPKGDCLVGRGVVLSKVRHGRRGGRGLGVSRQSGREDGENGGSRKTSAQALGREEAGESGGCPVWMKGLLESPVAVETVFLSRCSCAF